MEHTEFLTAGKLMTLYDTAMVTHAYQAFVETHRPCNTEQTLIHWLQLKIRHCELINSTMYHSNHQTIRWLRGKQSACQSRRHWFNPWIGKMPWRGKWQPTPVFLLRKSTDRGVWRATKSQTQLAHIHNHTNQDVSNGTLWVEGQRNVPSAQFSVNSKPPLKILVYWLIF